MGFLDKVKAKKAFGRVSENADTSVDLDEDKAYIYETKRAIKDAKKGDDGDGLFESREEARQRRGDAVRAKIAPIRKGVRTARKEIHKFKNDPDVKQIRKSFKSIGKDAEGGMSFGFGGGKGGQDIYGMLGFNQGQQRFQSKRKKRSNDPFDFSDIL